MNSVSLNKQDETLLAKYKPTIEDRDLIDLGIHPENTDDPTEGIEALAGTMEEMGQARPIICIPGNDGKPLIIDGSRIFAAAQLLGWVAVTIIVLTKIDPDEVISVMLSLKSHHRRMNYKVIAKRFEAVKAHAQKFLRENNVEENDCAKTTTRQYMQKILGFPNERYVSDFESILNSPSREYLLEQIDSGMWSFNKAAKKARGKNITPTPKQDSHKAPEEQYLCEDCPRRKAFQNKIEEGLATTIDDLKTEED
jgi:hypothetical protein